MKKTKKTPAPKQQQQKKKKSTSGVPTKLLDVSQGGGQSIAQAVTANAEVKIGDFRVQAAPTEFRKELIADEKIKRFHGNRFLLSWLPPHLLENNRDHFGYMFSARQVRSTALDYSLNVDRLKRLGQEIGAKDSSTTPDSPIPAGYTYLGQFIDHDITLDVSSDLGKRQDATDIPNMRSPALDLDALYGQGPGLDPFLYDHRPALGPAMGAKLLLGKNTNTGDGGPQTSGGGFANPFTAGNDFDVQRTADFTAIIGDPRNDENLIVSQLHHAFIKFHNKVVEKLIADGVRGDIFTEAKKVTTHHYQYMVIHDFLKRIADPAIVNRALSQPLRFLKGKKVFMPVEFSVAAYRFGHSMIRNGYAVNAPLAGQLNRPATLGEIFSFIRPGSLPVFSNWVIDFNLYFPAGPVPTINNTKFNNARKIDTRLAPGLNTLPNTSDAFLQVLAKRNLVRGLALGLPSGQAVAAAIGAPVLTEAELKQGNGAAENAILDESNGELKKKTPLWYYILKEAEVKAQGNSLGPVGSTILAETFVWLLKTDGNSFLNATPSFRPSLPKFDSGAPANQYTMTDILHFAGVLSLP